MTPFRGQKVKVIRPLNAVTENQPYLRNKMAYKLQTWRTDGVRWLASPILWWSQFQNNQNIYFNFIIIPLVMDNRKTACNMLHIQILENMYIKVTTCRGWWHIVAAPLQATQLVFKLEWHCTVSYSQQWQCIRMMLGGHRWFRNLHLPLMVYHVAIPQTASMLMGQEITLGSLFHMSVLAHKDLHISCQIC